MATVTILEGDALQTIKELPSDSVHCVVTTVNVAPDHVYIWRRKPTITVWGWAPSTKHEDDGPPNNNTCEPLQYLRGR